jgi:hypothetical protein
VVCERITAKNDDVHREAFHPYRTTRRAFSTESLSDRFFAGWQGSLRRVDLLFKARHDNLHFG